MPTAAALPSVHAVGSTAHDLLALQRAGGNRALGQALNRGAPTPVQRAATCVQRAGEEETLVTLENMSQIPAGTEEGVRMSAEAEEVLMRIARGEMTAEEAEALGNSQAGSGAQAAQGAEIAETGTEASEIAEVAEAGTEVAEVAEVAEGAEVGLGAAEAAGGLGAADLGLLGVAGYTGYKIGEFIGEDVIDPFLNRPHAEAIDEATLAREREQIQDPTITNYADTIDESYKDTWAYQINEWLED
jgi:hypothetical protein